MEEGGRSEDASHLLRVPPPISSALVRVSELTLEAEAYQHTKTAY